MLSPGRRAPESTLTTLATIIQARPWGIPRAGGVKKGRGKAIFKTLQVKGTFVKAIKEGEIVGNKNKLKWQI